ncbi:hypothetical protein QJS83_15410 [Bdellovibrio sp. 22V]|uniref:hypothetical protein n=1 Tax=Bdellovibrio sp. 22V TaxID=3044166 RepID=UPI002542C65A|nr:hypothetical protein [Bdellovibrio sp. 22V]WII71851.1 hypothetical protein QJS83_15410 [Bdellovibrio sp. 22V]
MRALSLSWLLGLCLFSTSVFAQSLPPAEELLAKAEQGRAQLKEVIDDVDKNLSKMREAKVFDAYFYMLDDLKELATKFNFEEIEPQAIEKLGLRMVERGTRWLVIAECTKDRLLYYHKWMSKDIAVRYMAQVEVEIGSLGASSKTRAAGDNLDALIIYVDGRFPGDTYLKEGYQRILSNIALKQLRQPKVSDEDALYWIGRLQTANSYSEYLSILDLQVTSTSTKAQLHVYAARVRAFADTLEFAGQAPEEFGERLGEVSIELILKFIRMEEPFKSDELEKLLSVLHEGQLHDLSLVWDSFKMVPSDTYIPHYFAASREFVEKLRSFDLLKEVAEVSKKVGTLGAPIMIRLLDGEGRYELRDGKNEKWFLILVKESETKSQAFLWKRGATQGKLYQKVLWDFENSSFVASEKDSDLSTPSYVKFKIRKGTVEYVNPFAGTETKSMKGRRTEKFIDYFKDASEVIDYSGSYLGKMTDAAGKDFSVQLKVSLQDEFYAGELTIVDGATVSLNHGASKDALALYLTASQEGQVEGFAHIRLRKIGTTLRGVMITPLGGTATLSLVQ